MASIAPRFDVPTARQYGREGRLEEWVHAYLSSGEWANPGLSLGLKLQQRWWNGPLELPLADLERCCGPEAEMEFRVDAHAWAVRTAQLAESLKDPLALPPLIAMYDKGSLSIRDGNHRYGAIQRLGWTTCWAVIWYNTEEDYHRHTECLVRAGRLRRRG
jgi:hypothetical protein